MSKSNLEEAQKLMRAEGVNEDAITVFAHYYEVLESGETGLIPEEEIRPFHEPLDASSFSFSDAERRMALSKTAVIRLNGGLGTSMGLSIPKTLITVRDDKNFLDICVLQILHVRREYDVQVPLIFMDSYNTDAPTLAYLDRYQDLPVPGLPLSFLQSKEPRLVEGTLAPLVLPGEEEAQWCPPGHGDIYTSLRSSGLLKSLREKGYRYVQVANGDNLGASLDPDLAAWFAASEHSFAMEVCERTENDKKGGHLARSKSGGLVLREIAQTPEDDLESFQDTSRHRYFNTNTIWLNLEALDSLMEDRGVVLGLPLIRNQKTVTSSKGEETQVVQIETAMGAAIGVFDNACAVEVSRRRFLPVKTTNELLLVRSDLFDLQDDGILRPTTETVPTVSLANSHYGRFSDFEQRVPAAPSLASCSSLTVQGDWYFAPNSIVMGNLLLGSSGGTYSPKA